MTKRCYNPAMAAGILKARRHVVEWGLIGLLGLGALACSKPSTINPEDAARIRNIDTTVELMRNSYLRERGHAIFRLVGRQNLSLSAVDGDAPFGMAGRRIQGERPRGR